MTGADGRTRLGRGVTGADGRTRVDQAATGADSGIRLDQAETGAESGTRLDQAETGADSGTRLDIVIPVYNEGANIVATLRAIAAAMKTPLRVLICYDDDDDDTLPAIAHEQNILNLQIELIRNRGRGAHGAILTGLGASDAPFVLVYPADDDYNADILDAMVSEAEKGCDIVCASRFMPGGSMKGCPLLKAALVRMANFTLYHLARLPTHDASNGFRLFSRRTVEEIPIESNSGFCYSIELLVKCHRLGWRIGEVPARWFQRKHGKSRFQVIKWLPAYLRWYAYAFVTTYLQRTEASVHRRKPKMSRDDNHDLAQNHEP